MLAYNEQCRLRLDGKPFPFLQQFIDKRPGLLVIGGELRQLLGIAVESSNGKGILDLFDASFGLLHITLDIFKRALLDFAVFLADLPCLRGNFRFRCNGTDLVCAIWTIWSGCRAARQAR